MEFLCFIRSEEFEYYPSTYDIDFEHPQNGGLPYEDLEWLLDSIPARKKLMLIDACHSGEVDKEELNAIKNVRDSLSGQGLAFNNRARLLNYEYKPVMGMKNSFLLMHLQNCLFTYSILELMASETSMNVSGLKEFVSERVVELTGGLQKPTSCAEVHSTDLEIW